MTARRANSRIRLMRKRNANDAKRTNAIVRQAMPDVSASLDHFVIDTFDSEEAVMIVLLMREARAALSAATVLDRLQETYEFSREEPRRLAEKRIELRLLDLVQRGLVQTSDRQMFEYGATGAKDALVGKLAEAFAANRAGINRLIYSTSAKARRVAEAFRL
jgi:hypothetical protein